MTTASSSAPIASISHIAHILRKGQHVVFDDAVIATHCEIREETLSFSEDSQRFAYAEGNVSRWRWVVDGHKEPLYSSPVPGGFSFSPDSHRFAYLVRESQTGFAVVDGTEGWHYDSVARFRPVFCPDSTRLAYVALVKPQSNKTRRRQYYT